MIEMSLLIQLIRVVQISRNIYLKLNNLADARDRIMGKLCDSEGKKSPESVTWQEFFDEMTTEEITELSLCVVDILVLFALPYEAVFIPYFFGGGAAPAGSSLGGVSLGGLDGRTVMSPEDVERLKLFEKEKAIECAMHRRDANQRMVALKIVNIVGPLLGVSEKVMLEALKFVDYDSLLKNGLMKFVITIVIHSYITKTKETKKIVPKPENPDELEEVD